MLNTLALELSACCPPYALKFSTWYLYYLNTKCKTYWHEIRKTDRMPRLSYHTQYFFICVYPDNDIVYSFQQLLGLVFMGNPSQLGY